MVEECVERVTKKLKEAQIKNKLIFDQIKRLRPPTT